MKVSKAKAQENREHIVSTAAELFRERGYDRVGVAELMAAAGFTHGGFYKHFGSKADLMAEAATAGFSQTAAKIGGADMADFVRAYVSRDHRDARRNGCTMAALCGDAARQPDAIKVAFAAGVESTLANLQGGSAATLNAQTRAMAIDTIAHAIGAIVLSRSCPDDSALADEILEVCRAKILALLAED